MEDKTAATLGLWLQRHLGGAVPQFSKLMPPLRGARSKFA